MAEVPWQGIPTFLLLLSGEGSMWHHTRRAPARQQDSVGCSSTCSCRQSRRWRGPSVSGPLKKPELCSVTEVASFFLPQSEVLPVKNISVGIMFSRVAISYLFEMKDLLLESLSAARRQQSVIWQLEFREHRIKPLILVWNSCLQKHAFLLPCQVPQSHSDWREHPACLCSSPYSARTFLLQ